MTTTREPSALPAAGHLPQAELVRATVAIAIVVLAAALPLALTPYQTGLATEVLIFGILAMSIDLLAGFADRTSLAHGAIFGAGPTWSSTRSSRRALRRLSPSLSASQPRRQSQPSSHCSQCERLASISCC